MMRWFIWLLSPEAYLAACAADLTTTRLEGPDQALIRERDVLSAWKNHPHQTVVPAHSDSLQPKIDAVMAIAARMMGIEL